MAANSPRWWIKRDEAHEAKDTTFITLCTDLEMQKLFQDIQEWFYNKLKND